MNKGTVDRIASGFPGMIKAAAIYFSAWLAMTLIVAVSIIYFNFAHGARPVTADDLTMVLVISMMASMMVGMVIIVSWSIYASLKERFARYKEQ
ncbi:hypothetical protein [Kushneria indalinina]|uniref:Uncharacterized protein n=1 Tax=Kushneria indalinina DSM 14324 TaxID=1122140 RepID=A0A3D9E0V4_9GAMM|nr:hypothetical protein [Kushneria indalinina]REC96673.1 hypothetical protein C8D72_0005 [Kushneria indalinina DSM 14324]